MVMPPEASIERRRRDGRLAWLIVGASAMLTVALIVMIFSFARGRVGEWLTEQGREMQAGARPRPEDGDIREKAAATTPSAQSDQPLPIAQGPAPPDTARPVGRPAGWIDADDYPPTAQRMGYEGRVRVTVSVDQAGRPTGCAVRRSSGHWSLDNATCAAMLNKGRFDVAARGPRVRHWTSPVIRWALPSDREVTKTGA